MSNNLEDLNNTYSYPIFNSKKKVELHEYLYSLLSESKTLEDEGVKAYFKKYYNDYIKKINISKKICDPFTLKLAKNSEMYNEYVFPILQIDYDLYINILNSLIKTNRKLVCESANKIISNQSYSFDKDSKSENIILEDYINDCVKNFTCTPQKVNDIFKYILFKKLSEKNVRIMYKGLSWKDYYEENIKRLNLKPNSVNKAYLKQKYDAYCADSGKDADNIMVNLDTTISGYLNRYPKEDKIYILLRLIFRVEFIIILKKNLENKILIKNNADRIFMIFENDGDFHSQIFQCFSTNITADNYAHNETLNYISSLYGVLQSDKIKSHFDCNYRNGWCFPDYYHFIVRDRFDDRLDELLESREININNYVGFTFEYYNNRKRKDLRTILKERQNIINGHFDNSIKELEPLLDSRNACVQDDESKRYYDDLMELYNQIIKRSIRKTNEDELLDLMNTNEIFNQLINSFEKEIKGTKAFLEGIGSITKQNKVYDKIIEVVTEELNRYRSLIDKKNNNNIQLSIKK